MKPPLVLLNPPGRRPYIRNYFCSQTSKAHFINQPIDLIMQSAWLQEAYELHLVDAILDGLTPDDCLRRLSELRPEAVVFLSGVVSWEEDREFLSEARERIDVPMIGIGDVFLEEPERYLSENRFLDGVLLDFTTSATRDFLEGKDEIIRGMVFRRNGRITRRERSDVRGGEFSIPLPRHELFLDRGYSFPFVRDPHHATVLTDFGCPFRCGFCVMGQLGSKFRPIENLLPELDRLHQLGVREIFFIDQSFGVWKDRNLAFYRQMVERRYGFGWVCYSRVDLVDPPTLQMMKEAGCHTIIFGVESADESLLRAWQKGYTVPRIKEAFRACREAGIQTVGTFLLGLPEDTEETVRATIRLAASLDCDYASFNVAFPRPTTPLRRIMLEQGLSQPGNGGSDQAGSFVGIRTFHLGPHRLAGLQRAALRRFYLRPRFLLRRLATLHGWKDFLIKARNGLHIFFRNALRPRGTETP